MKVMSDIIYDGARKVYLEYPVLVPIEDTWPNGVKPAKPLLSDRTCAIVTILAWLAFFALAFVLNSGANHVTY